MLKKISARMVLSILIASVVLLSLAACGRVQQVSNSEYGAFSVDIASAQGESPVAIAWYDTRHESADIYLRLLDDDLLPASREWRLTDGIEQAYEPDIVVDEQHVAVVWYSEVESRANTGRVYFALYDHSGQELLRTALSVVGTDARIPAIAATDDGFFVAWLEGAVNNGRTSSQRQLMGVWLERNGDLRVAAHAIAPASPSTWNLNLAVADAAEDRVLLVYDADFETAVSELYVVEVTPQHSQLNRLTANDGYDSKYPDLALSSRSGEGVAALTWYDELYGNNEIYLLQLPEEALFYSDVQNFLELQATRITQSEGDSIGAYLAWQGERLALVWSEPVSRRYEIFYQLWNSSGEAVTEATRLTNSRDDSYIPSIAAYRERFAVAWSEVSVVGALRDAQLSRSEIAVQYID